LEKIKTWRGPFDINILIFFTVYAPKKLWENTIGKSEIAEEFFKLNNYNESPLTMAFKVIELE
jgi:hypothetical protein